MENGDMIRLNMMGARRETVWYVTGCMVYTYEGGEYHISKVVAA
jgi:hypothetical protein